MNPPPFQQQFCLVLTDNHKLPPFIGAAHPDIDPHARWLRSAPKMNDDFTFGLENMDMRRAMVIGERRPTAPHALTASAGRRRA
jgi:hypothetical protein